jgi:hypothetical protein
MKKISLLSIALLVFAGSYAQKTVKLKINHLLDDEVFAFNDASMNNIGTSFNVSRLEYYISEISVVHDGGTETVIEDFWILENASESKTHTLGDIDLTTVDSIKFSIGVNEEVNHADPSKYSADHPLSPKMPSMHWGWTSGYRFVAIEGNAGLDLNKAYEIHALGDENYYSLSIPVSGKDDNGDVLIEVNAEYKESIRNIDVSRNVITHGGFGEAIVLLKNFWVDVFSSTDGTKNTLDIESTVITPNVINLYPNPSSGENITVALGNSNQYQSLKVIDLTGREVLAISVIGQVEATFELQQKGVYFVKVMGLKGEVLETKKLLVQ